MALQNNQILDDLIEHGFIGDLLYNQLFLGNATANDIINQYNGAVINDIIDKRSSDENFLKGENCDELSKFFRRSKRRLVCGKKEDDDLTGGKSNKQNKRKTKRRGGKRNKKQRRNKRNTKKRSRKHR